MIDTDVVVSRSLHRPLHAYADGQTYWITASTLYHQPFLRADIRKDHFAREMLSAAAQWSVEIVAWTLVEHHYHAIVLPEHGNALPKFIGRLHGQTARYLNRCDGVEGRVVWRQYWDTFQRTEGDFWSRVNYIWWNPVRHGFCAAPEDWPWTNLHELMADADADTRKALQRFPPPRKLPGDDW